MELGDAVLPVAAWQLVLGGFGLFVASSLGEPQAEFEWPPAFVGLLGFLGVIGTALATALWYWLLQRDDVGRLTLALFVVPVLGLVLGTLFFGERLSNRELAESALIFLSLGAVELEPRITGAGSSR